MLAPFKLLPRQVGSLFVAGIQTPSLSISPPVAGMQSPSLSIYARRCTLDFFTLGRKDRTNQENLVQSYRICLSSVLFKSVKAGFLPSYSTMTRSMKVSGFLVASVPFTLTEYFTSPITSLHPLVFPDEYRDLRGELDVFSRIASGFRSLADSFQLGLAASSADVTRRLANTPSDVGPSFSSSRRWSGRRCRP